MADDRALIIKEARDAARANPAIMKYIQLVRQHDIAALGTDEAFVIRGDDGQIKAFKQRLLLSAENGGLVQPVWNGPYVISAQGYEMINEATGTTVMFPLSVHVDGVTRPNPYVVKDQRTGAPLEVHCRALAMKYSAHGLPMGKAWTTVFDVKKYRVSDLLAKAKKSPKVFRVMPADIGPPKEDGIWAKTPINDELTLYYDTSHPEVLGWLSQTVNREKKIIDFAQTFAARNAAKHLHGLQKVPGQDGGKPIPYWELTLTCWRPSDGGLLRWDERKYENARRSVEQIVSGEITQIAYDEPPIVIEHGVESEADALVEEETPSVEQPDAEAPEDEQEPADESVSPTENADEADIFAAFRDFQSDANLRDDFSAACRVVDVDPKSDQPTGLEARAVVNAMIKRMEAS